MRVGFIADIHIKIGQKNVPATWAINRYHTLFDSLAKYNNAIDIWVVGGDTFDKIPNIEELEVFFDMLMHFEKPTYIYSGNHEALKKNTTFLSSLKSVCSRLNKNITIIDDFFSIHGIDFIPYNKLKEWEKDPDNTFIGLGNILCTHVRGEIPPHVKAEIPLELFDKWKIVLAGDLHSYDNCQRNILYPGSPVTTSFHRNKVDTGFIILNTGTLAHEWIKLEVPQLIRKTIKAGEATPTSDYHHIIYEVEGDIAELAALEDNELVDKRVIKRATDTSLMLEPDMTLEEELKEYLQFILQLDDRTVEEALKAFNDSNIYTR